MTKRIGYFQAATASIALMGAASLVDAAPSPPNLVYHLDASDPLENGGTSLPVDGAGLPTWFNIAPGSSLPDEVKAPPVEVVNPTWHLSAGPNGTPAIRLNNGTPAYYKAATASGFNFLHNGSNHTVFVVTKTALANPNAYMAIFETGAANTGGDIGYTISYYDNSGRNDTIFAGMANDTDWVTRTDILTPDNITTGAAWQMYTVTYDNPASNPQMRVYVNGNQAGTANETAQPHNPANGSAGGLFIGSAYPGNQLFNGFISEVLVYDRLLSFNEVRNVNQYIEDKYDLGITNVPEPASALLLLASGWLMVRRRVDKVSA